MMNGLDMYTSMRRRRDQRRREEEEMKEKSKREALEREIASIGKRAEVDSNEFKMLWSFMIGKNNEVIDNAFRDLLIQAKLIFGTEIGEIHAKRERDRIAYQQREILRQKESRIYREKQRQIRHISDLIRSRRRELLREIDTNKKLTLNDFRGTTKYRHIIELLGSNHLRITVFFNRLRVCKTTDIPTTKTMDKISKKYERGSGYYAWP